MIKSNYHSHTTRCNHAYGTDEAYVKEAIEAGYKILGFSDHAPWPVVPHEVQRARMHMDLEEDYRSSVLSLKEQYKDQIEILCAVEAEYYENRLEHLEYLYNTYDYLILGNHFYQYESNKTYYGRYVSQEKVLEHYVETSLKALETGYYKIFAHPDLFVRSVRHWDEACVEASLKLIRKAKECGVYLEYNCGGIRNEWQPYNYPLKAFWELVKQEGNTVIIGVDAHRPEHLSDTESIEKAIHDLNELGIEWIELKPEDLLRGK